MNEKKYLIIEEEDIVAIGDAIREKESSSESIPTKEMPDRIRNIKTGTSPEALYAELLAATYGTEASA